MWYLIYFGMIASAIQFPSNVICFDQERSLQKSDFKKSSASEKDRMVYGDFGISYHTEQNLYVRQLDICAYFNPYRSYCAMEPTADAMLHEQYRWKIYQLAKLEMVQSYHNRKLDFDNINSQILLDDIKVKYTSMDRQFNVTTKYGTVPEKSARWHSKIDSLHGLLRTYQDTIFYIK
jgi:hypothetical protein